MTSDPVGPVRRPTQSVVVYDGDCPFCRSQVERIRRRDTGGTFEYVPRQVEGLERRFPKLSEGDFNSGMRLVRPDGSVLVAADAVYEIARQLKGWRRLAWLYRLPLLRNVFRFCYGWIARNRHRLAANCESGACEADWQQQAPSADARD